MSKEKDHLWEQTKTLVDKRDHHQCQLAKCLSVSEYHQLKPERLTQVDRCHIFSRSTHPLLIYNKNNIISLSRYIHHRMDSFKDPIYGNNCDLNEHFWWWWRIKNHSMEKYDSDIDYEEKLLKEIK
jgi:hypothetical protein